MMYSPFIISFRGGFPGAVGYNRTAEDMLSFFLLRTLAWEAALINHSSSFLTLCYQ